MEYGNESELYFSLSLYGGILLAGLLIAIALGGLIIMARRQKKRQTIIKELYGEKERTNGQSKGGSIGKF